MNVEDNRPVNAGTGSVPNVEGAVEINAAIIDRAVLWACGVARGKTQQQIGNLGASSAGRGTSRGARRRHTLHLEAGSVVLR